MRESRLSASQAGMVCSGLTGLTIPKDAIATRACHRAPATYFVEQTAMSTFTKTSFDLLGKTPGIGATGLYEVGKEGFRAMELVDEYISDASGGNGNQDLGDPIRVSRTAGYIDHR